MKTTNIIYVAIVKLGRLIYNFHTIPFVYSRSKSEKQIVDLTADHGTLAIFQICDIYTIIVKCIQTFN